MAWCEVHRYCSFQFGWKRRLPDAADLSRAGFFYLGYDQAVQCAFCSGRITHWKPTDRPLLKHCIAFPTCPFIVDPESTGNISLNNNYSFPEQWSPPFYKNMKTKENRLRTFLQERGEGKQKWNKIISPDRLAAAGFFYTGFDTKCYICAGTLNEWKESDDPQTEHDKHFIWCQFYRQQQQEKELAIAAAAALCNNSSSSDRTLLCKICYENDLQILFHPCGHILSCEECAKVMSHCPICRNAIETYVKAFFA